MVNIAKFFRSTKASLANAKESLEQEMNISELKREAMSYKEELTSASKELSRVTSMANLDDDYDLVHDTATAVKAAPAKEESDTKEVKKTETVTFEKKKKNVEPKNKEENA
jgi:sec-independent protein translocase protein TatB